MARVGSFGLKTQFAAGVKRTAAPSAPMPKIVEPSIDDRSCSLLRLASVTLPTWRSIQSGWPRVSTADRRPASGSKARTRSRAGAESDAVQTVESIFGYAVTRAMPPLLGTRSTRASGPGWAAGAAAMREGGRSERVPPEQAAPKASTSADAMSERTLENNSRRCGRRWRPWAGRREGDWPLEGRPQRPGPHAAVAVLVDGNGEVPAQDGVVEQVEPKSKAVAAKWVALGCVVVVRRPRQVHALSARPGNSRVVEEYAVDRRHVDWQEPELDL